MCVYVCAREKKKIEFISLTQITVPSHNDAHREVHSKFRYVEWYFCSEREISQDGVNYAGCISFAARISE